ncbi:MAG TPA: hypothetical protein VG929_09735 [Actinomycetota bacterium]|nr:hypothetical protein [Actinomycetota bacterium]
MEQLFCPNCRLQQPVDHRWCVSCGEALPSHLIAARAQKVARFFAGIKVGGDDPENGYLRVSCYNREQRIESPEGSVTIPGSHVRVSMWVDDEARCVMSLPSSEAREMATFILAQVDANQEMAQT